MLFTGNLYIRFIFSLFLLLVTLHCMADILVFTEHPICVVGILLLHSKCDCSPIIYVLLSTVYIHIVLYKHFTMILSDIDINFRELKFFK